MNYETNDTYLSGYLVAMGVPIQSHCKDGNTTVFSFEQTDELDELVEKYYSLRALISPQSYGAALKILKNLIYQSNHIDNNYGRQRMFNEARKGN